FLDDDREALRGYEWAGSVVAPVTSYTPEADDLFTVTIGDPRTKLAVAAALASRGARFAALVHPSAVLGASVELGQGVVLCPHACITADVQMGDHVHLNVSA